jgi:hypothetical protein
MFVIGFNLRSGLEREGGEGFRPSRLLGLGFGWSKSSLLRPADIKRAAVAPPKDEASDLKP